MPASWREFRNGLNLTPEEEEMIDLEKALINAVIEAE